MNKYLQFAKNLENVITKENVMINEPMKNHTSFKVGGRADVFVTPASIDEVVKTILLCKNEKVPFYIMGFGSNILVKDGGIRGAVIKLEKLNSFCVEGETMRVQCGLSFARACREALSLGLSGLEFACGIPGTVGGAVAMNAGAYGGEVNDVIVDALVMDKDGVISHLNKEQLQLGYRNSSILKQGLIVLESSFRLKRGDHTKMKDMVDDLMKRRAERQPLNYPSAGSTFKRPSGFYAGKLIEDSGLKGVNIGGAEVSDKHSGFIINKDNATAKDILKLIEHVQKTVDEIHGVVLEPEVRIIGEDSL